MQIDMRKKSCATHFDRLSRRLCILQLCNCLTFKLFSACLFILSHVLSWAAAYFSDKNIWIQNKVSEETVHGLSSLRLRFTSVCVRVCVFVVSSGEFKLLYCNSTWLPVVLVWNLHLQLTRTDGACGANREERCNKMHWVIPMKTLGSTVAHHWG